MASSSEYYNKYKEYKEKAEKLGKNIKALQTIRDNLSDTFSDEQNNVNKELSELLDDLNLAVKHDTKFSTTASSAYNQNKEPSTTSDSNLNSALSSINSELSSLSAKKTEAEKNRDEYYRKYEEKKKEEQEEARQALADRIKNMFS